MNCECVSCPNSGEYVICMRCFKCNYYLCNNCFNKNGCLNCTRNKIKIENCHICKSRTSLVDKCKSCKRAFCDSCNMLSGDICDDCEVYGITKKKCIIY